MKQFYKLSSVILILLIVMCTPAIAATEYDYTLDPNTGRRVSIPLAYSVDKVLTYDVDGKPLNQGNDLFIDKHGLLYIVDTGNDRIIKSQRNGDVVGVYTEGGDKPLKEPRGIFVDDDGDMYIADKGNGRIVHLSPNGEYVEEFGDFDSPLLGDDFRFEPGNVCVTPTGYIYSSKGHSILTIDANNEFRGYVGSIEIGFSLKRALIRMFASEQQKGRISRDLPPSYSKITLSDDGLIYATSVNTSSEQIIALNSVGKNVFRTGAFGETVNDEGEQIVPYFKDIALDKNGIVNALEQRSGKIYQYDSEGNTIAVIGGLGNKKGKFRMPSALEVDDEGRIYVLDYERNNIQIFEPTNFIQTVHQAIIKHDKGRYAEAKELWEEVLKIDASYSLAHKGIGKALMKEKDWEGALGEYTEAEDMSGYSEAFDEYRKDFVRNKFGIVLLAIIVIAVVGFLALTKSKQIAGDLVDKYTKWQGGV